MGYNDIIDSMREEIEMRRRNMILKEHKFSITQMTERRKTGDLVRYRTYLPDEHGKRGKAVAKNSLKELEDVIGMDK